MTHLEHVRPDPGANPHAIVANRYRQWRADGVLCRDARPALYRYDHTFFLDGERRTRRGIFAAVQLARWDERIILPHERTFPGPVAERLGRVRAVRANLSPVYLLAHDRSGAFGRLLADETGEPLAETTDPDGETHTLARIDDPTAIAEVAGVLGSTQLFVADGHHRYEAALALRDELRKADGASVEPAGPEFVLALIADAADPDVLILPTHRLVRGLGDVDPEEIRRRLGELFTLEPAGPVSAGAVPETGDAISLIRFAGEAAWWRLRAKSGRPHERLMPADRSSAWRRLPAAVLETAVFEHVLGLPAGDLQKYVRFTHEAAAAARAVGSGSAQIAFVLPAPSVADLVAVAEAGDRMPPKSTYFYPKVPAGLVVYDFAES